MTVRTQRTPRLEMSPRDGRARYASVICSGTKSNGHPCRRLLGEVSIDNPCDVMFRCHSCHSSYELQLRVAAPTVLA
jgi:hypothetical protein